MYIFAGSYERFIFGFSASADCSQPQEIVKRYTFAAHKSAVKCLAAAGPYVASGGADDLIHMYDMKAERDLGVLMNPCDGAVPCLEFYTPEGRTAPSHMLGGSADGAINIWRCRDWEHLKVMRGHKGSVNRIAVHHSGRLALSTARDSSIRMWNLARGRCTYTAPLEAEADDVAFTPGGESYYLVAGGRITVHSTSGEGGLLAAASAPRRILAVAAPGPRMLLLGLEDGSVRLWDVRTSGWAGGWERAHASRVRGMVVLQQQGPDQLPLSLATASSDGTIKLWDTRRLGGRGGDGPAATCTAQVSTNARLTCLAAVDPHAAGPRWGRTKPDTAAAAGSPAAKKARKDAALEAKAESTVPVQRKGPKPTPAAAVVEQQQKRPQILQQQRLKGKQVVGSRSGHSGQDEPGFEVVPAEYGDDDVYDNDDGSEGQKDEEDVAGESDEEGGCDAYNEEEENEDDGDEDAEEEGEEEEEVEAGPRGRRDVGSAGGRFSGKRPSREEGEEEEEEAGQDRRRDPWRRRGRGQGGGGGRGGDGRRPEAPGWGGRRGGGRGGGAGSSGRQQPRPASKGRGQGQGQGQGQGKARAGSHGEKVPGERAAKKPRFGGGDGGSSSRGGQAGGGAPKGKGGSATAYGGKKPLVLKQKYRNGRA